MKKENIKMSWYTKTFIIIGSIFGGLFSLILVTLLSFNIAKIFIYSDYYSVREIVCTNNGLGNNFVSQGTAITNNGKYIITSGYMSNKAASRVYITEIESGKYTFVSLEKEEGVKSTYHFGGVAVSGDTIYLAANRSIYTISLENAIESETITIKKIASVNCSASYIFCDDTYLYVGEFFDGGQYKTNNSFEYNGRAYNALVEKYAIGSYDSPQAVYWVRDRVQGFAMNELGDVVLSTSYGITSSIYYYYKNNAIIPTGAELFGAPTYVLETEHLTLNGPAMSEDLDYLDGKFYTNFETASNKYIFGKFFFNADKIVSLDFSKLGK